MLNLFIKEYKTPVQRKDRFYEMLFNSGNHALIAGTTGSGKSVLLNNGICYLMNNNTPANMQFIFIDPKKVELMQYRKTRYNLRTATEIKDINNILDNLIVLMNKRYKKMLKAGEKKSSDKKIIVVVDEIADIFTAYGDASKQAIKSIKILLAKSRAANIHFIICTQAPNRKTIPAEIVLNIPTRCALHCMKNIESTQIINTGGAELLPKYGECLLLSPELLHIEKYKINMFSEEMINKTIKAWSRGGCMVIK